MVNLASGAGQGLHLGTEDPNLPLASGEQQVVIVDGSVGGAEAEGGTPAVVLGAAAAAGVATTFLRTDDTIEAFDATAPSTQASADSPVVGTATAAARRDHKHGMPIIPAAAAGGTPAVVLGAAAAPGSAATFVRTDGTLEAFDATAPTTQAFGDAAVVGTAAKAARRDHKHAMPAAPSGGNLNGPTIIQQIYLKGAFNGNDSITLPATPQTGDVIVYFMGSCGGGRTTDVSGAGATWTRIVQDGITDNNYALVDVWLGVVGATPSTGISISAGGGTEQGGVLVVRGPAGIFDASSVGKSNAMPAWTNNQIVVAGPVSPASGAVCFIFGFARAVIGPVAGGYAVDLIPAGSGSQPNGTYICLAWIPTPSASAFARYHPATDNFCVALFTFV